MGDLGVVLGHLGATLGGLGPVFRRSWGGLGGSWGGLGRSWGDLGWSWGVLGRSWGALGGSWEAPGAPLGEPKSIQKSIRNLIRKQAESRRKINALELRLSMFQSLTGGAGNQIRSDSKSIETAFEVISSNIYLLTPCLVALIIT